MSTWIVYEDRGGRQLGRVDASDSTEAIARAIGKFDAASPGLVYVRRLPDVPKDVAIDLTKIKLVPAVVPDENEKQDASEILWEDDTAFECLGIGNEEWRDGEADDGSVTSEDVLD